MDRKHNLANDLFDLSQLDDQGIDTSDIPERKNFKNGARARYFDLRVRDYDVRAIANWCLKRAKIERVLVTSMWLNKIVYFIHEKALQEYRVLLTPAKVEAWDHGPVFREIYYQFKDETDLLYSFDIENRKRVIASEAFTAEDFRIFDSVWKRFGHMSAAQLRRISHEDDSPWHVVWSHRGKTNPGMVIETTTIIGHTDGRKYRQP